MESANHLSDRIKLTLSCTAHNSGATCVNVYCWPIATIRGIVANVRFLPTAAKLTIKATARMDGR
jgi:hypothetical protein